MNRKSKIGVRICGAVLSLRTRYALMTAFFLLLAMAMFYAGGRIVLLHFIRDAEQQMRDVGKSVFRLAYRQAGVVRTAAVRTLAEPTAETADARSLLLEFGQPFSVVAEFAPDGRFVQGVMRKSLVTPVVNIAPEDLSGYASVLASWVAASKSKDAASAKSAATGIVRLAERLHNVVMLPRGEGCLMMGMLFSADAFSERRGENMGGFEIRVGSVRNRGRGADRFRRTDERSNYGIAPMLSEAMDFYSGGFWKLSDGPVDAVFAIRDIAGNSVSTISVSLPKTFSGATRVAIGRLAFFIAVIGILFVIPLFWAQNRILMNPLTKMIGAIRDLGEHAADIDCPRVEWKGKDEFAKLAESVNRMVETIAAKTVSVANIEASHQALIDGVPDALVVFDSQGRLVSISKHPEGVAQIPGLFPGETPAAAVFGQEAVADFASAIDRTFRLGTVGKVRLKVQRPIGVPKSVPTRHFEVRLTRMGELFVLAIIRDVSAEVAEHKLRLAAEQRTLDVSKRESLTSLAAGIAHDMNNVLSVVLHAAESNDADPSGDSLRALTTIRAAVRRGSGMMRELMTFAGENRMKLMRAKPKMMMEDIRQLAVQLVGENIILSINTDSAAPDVDIDPNQFWKVLFNIVKNAGEAIGSRPGHIELCVVPHEMTEREASTFVSEHPLQPGRGSLFLIEDDGPGIPQELIGRIFDPYVSSKSLGRGLGLATVRTIVEAHGGGIRVLSRPEEGTVFQIFLPMSRMPAEEADASATDEKVVLSGDVLVVDNDESILKTMSILLKTLRLNVHVARNRRESLAIVRRYADRLRAIILDAHLDGIDSVRLLGAFSVGAPHVPVIVSSGSQQEEIAEMFKAHPYAGFLAKPYTLNELKQMLMDVAGKSGRAKA